MKRDNPLVDGGTFAFVLGAMAFFPPLFDYEFFITAWLGSMQQPAGLSAMIVGGLLVAAGKLREFRNASPVVSPTDQTGQGSVVQVPGADTEGSREPSSAPPA